MHSFVPLPPLEYKPSLLDSLLHLLDKRNKKCANLFEGKFENLLKNISHLNNRIRVIPITPIIKGSTQGVIFLKLAHELNTANHDS